MMLGMKALCLQPINIKQGHRKMDKQNFHDIPTNYRLGDSDDRLQYVPNQKSLEHSTSKQPQQPTHDLVEIKQLLASSQQQLKAAQQQIETLTKTNERFRQKLIRLAKICMQARHFANHDDLTGLPNRSLLLDRLKQVIAQSARQQKQVALLFIDLDKFKNVNDRFGHLAGDKLLQQVAARLAECVRYGDTVCRYGGDEFVIMLTEIDAKESAATMMEKIRARLSSAYVLDGHIIEITASIGVALYRTDGQNCNDLIKQADLAMYLAKVAQQPVNTLSSTDHTELSFS